MTARETVDSLDALIKSRPVPDVEHVIVSGWRAYGESEGGPGFKMRPLHNPLQGASVLPLKLAVRMSEFTGGSICTATYYLSLIREVAIHQL